MKKQQKRMQEGATDTSLAIRKGKREEKTEGNKVKVEDVEKIFEEKRDCGVQTCNNNGQALVQSINDQWDEFAFSWDTDVVDEQMPYWCTSWCPLWDVEGITDLHDDLLWEDDIWDLKAIQDVPSP